MEIIKTTNAPEAIGPYSQAVKTNGFIFCSGQIALTSEGQMLNGPIEEQAKQVMDNLKAVVEAAGSSLDKIVKTTIYLADINDYQSVNEIYGSYFTDKFPARAAVQVAVLPRNAKIEMEAICLE